MATRHDPRLLYSVGGIKAYHIQDGHESALTPSGPQTLSLLLVPTAHEEDAPSYPLGDTEPGARPMTPEEDFYLHLNLPPELDIPMPATTQVFHQPPSSYLIPRWDLGPDAGAFTRIDFPKIGSGADRVSQEEIDTFETILAQCTAFMEKNPVPAGKMVPYDPSQYKPGEGYVGGGSSALVKGENHGHIVLIDEEDGSVVGELGDGYEIDEKTGVRPGDKNPVEIEMPNEGHPNRITVTPVSEEYLAMSRHPAYKNSRIVQNAAMASRLIVTGSSGLASVITSGANAFTAKTKPVAKPMTFSPATQERVRKLNNLTHGAVGLSAKTVGQLGKVAQNLGATLARKDQAKHSKTAASTGGVDKHGRPLPPAEYKPSLLNKSMIAFSTIMDGAEQSAKHLLNTGATASSTVVSHRWGPDAGNVAGSIAGGVRNVGLVYVDATGVSRKAVIKSVAKGMVVGRMPNGDQLLVGEGDGGQVPQDAQQKMSAPGGFDGQSSTSGKQPASALDAARMQANAQANAASPTSSAPPPYSDPTGAGSRVGDTKYR